jgi:hypothetical protein
MGRFGGKPGILILEPNRKCHFLAPTNSVMITSHGTYVFENNSFGLTMGPIYSTVQSGNGSRVDEPWVVSFRARKLSDNEMEMIDPAGQGSRFLIGNGEMSPW